jgi:DNA-binding transcriptional MerR regulator
MQIRELSRRTGADPATIRYYEREGLLQPPARTASGYRRYGPEAVERLTFIRHCRSLDIPLRDVRRLLSLLDQRDASCDEINVLVDTQLEHVRQKRRELEALERQLGGLRAQCCERHRVADCGIVDELLHAARGEACACHPAPIAEQGRS